MALHRDIYWVGRQWAVTGHGMQACDQKQKGQFDIEIARLWDEGLAEGLRQQKWFNAEDFDKGLAIARARYPAQPRDLALPEAIPPLKSDEPVEPLRPAPQQFVMRIKGWPAKFVRPWRVRLRR